MTTIIQDKNRYYKDENGQVQLMTPIDNEDWILKVEKGLVPGHRFFDKFGENPNISGDAVAQDVWEGTSLYNFTSPLGAEYFMSSSDESDTQPIKWTLLTIDENDKWVEETVTVNLDGQNKVAVIPDSGNTPVRVWRGENESKDLETGEGESLSGTIYLYEDDTITDGEPDTASKIRAIINNGNNQTLMCIWTVPDDYVAFLYRGEAGVSKSGGVSAAVDLTYRSRRFGGVFKVKKKITSNTNGTSIYTDPRTRRDPIPPRTDIVIRKELSSAASVGAFGTLDVIMIHKDYLPDEFWAAVQSS